jgi:hypothetical protein
MCVGNLVVQGCAIKDAHIYPSGLPWTLKTCPKPPRCPLPSPTNQSQGPQLSHWLDHRALGQWLPPLGRVAKAAATPPWPPVFVNRSYGDHPRMTPWGRVSSCVQGAFCSLGTSLPGYPASSPHGRQQQVVGHNLTVSGWRVTKCVH